MTYSIVPIVEGYAETESVPVLMRRLVAEWCKYHIEIAKPVRVKRYQVVKVGELERRVELAMTRPGCRAVVLILDAEDDCPKDIAPQLAHRARQVAQHALVSVVLANSELESWFVGSLESLRGVRGISSHACSPNDPEAIRDAKTVLSRAMERNRHYTEVADQPAFAARFDFTQASQNCRSFRKFQSDFRGIVQTLSQSS